MIQYRFASQNRFYYNRYNNRNPLVCVYTGSIKVSRVIQIHQNYLRFDIIRTLSQESVDSEYTPYTWFIRKCGTCRVIVQFLELLETNSSNMRHVLRQNRSKYFWYCTQRGGGDSISVFFINFPLSVWREIDRLRWYDRDRQLWGVCPVTIRYMATLVWNSAILNQYHTRSWIRSV